LVENHDLFCFFSGKTINDSTHLSKGSVWPRKYGALGLSTYIAIGAADSINLLLMSTLSRAMPFMFIVR
jgi:hypothetical protein